MAKEKITETSTTTKKTAAETTVETTKPEIATNPEPSGCTEETVPVPERTKPLYINEGRFAMLECKTGYKFPTASDGAYFCIDNEWFGNIPSCIRRSFS